MYSAVFSFNASYLLFLTWFCIFTFVNVFENLYICKCFCIVPHVPLILFETIKTFIVKVFSCEPTFLASRPYYYKTWPTLAVTARTLHWTVYTSCRRSPIPQYPRSLSPCNKRSNAQTRGSWNRQSRCSSLHK